ncbi:MAG: tetratricopeptide repeat protein [Actinomycetota bacterium]|nr:tetratricopeptide repeat protein [Actinomycetota bacterium]
MKQFQANNQTETTYSLLNLGRELLEGGELEEAALVLERARARDPRKGSILEVLGKAYFSFGEYRRAALRFSEAIEVDPTNDFAHYCLGLCMKKLGRNTDAGKHFKIAWYLRPRQEYRNMAMKFGACSEDGSC